MDRKELNDHFFKSEIWIHYQYVKKLLYTLTLDSSLTEDLAQDTMIRCWKKVESFRKYSNIRAAVCTVAKNEFRQYHRSKGKGKEDLTDPLKLRWLINTSNIEDYIRQEGDIHEILLLFGGIKKEYVQIVLLADYYGIPIKDISKMLHKNYNTTVSQHARGLEEIRKKKDLYDKLMRRNA